MPRRSGTAVLRMSTVGASTRRLEHQLSAAQRDTHRLIQTGLQQIGFDIEFFLQGHAPERTKHLKHSIDSFMVRSSRMPSVTIIIDVTDPEHKYDYVNVTRFGRKAVKVKRPAVKSKKLGAKPILFGRQLARRSGAALKFEPGAPGSGFIFRRSAKAWRPTGGDWIGRTAPQVKQYADETMAEVADFIQKEIAGRKGVRFSGSRRIRSRVLR